MESFENFEIPLVRTSCLSELLDMDRFPCLCWSYSMKSMKRCMLKVKGLELDDSVHILVVLYYVLPFPASRTSQPCLPVWHAGS